MPYERTLEPANDELAGPPPEALSDPDASEDGSHATATRDDRRVHDWQTLAAETDEGLERELLACELEGFTVFAILPRAPRGYTIVCRKLFDE